MDFASSMANHIHTGAPPGKRRKPQCVRQILSELKPFGVVIPQDKSPKAAVGWRIHSYWQALYCNFILDRQHYEVMWSWTPQDLVHEQFLKHLDLVPCMFQRSASSWQVSRIARAYLTVKRKCFQPLAGLSCSKSHAHFREIISNARDPLKRPLRTLSRLWQIALKQSGRPSWELWKLSDAVPELNSIHSELVQHASPDMTCKRCHAEKADIECIVADISQLFKDVEPFSVVVAAARLAEFCRLKLFVAGVSIFPGPRVKGYLGGNPWRKHGLYVSFRHMVQFIAYYVCHAYFLLGNLVVKQRCGVPMGGAASKCASSLLLADHEAKWLTDGSLRLAHGFGYDSAAFHKRTIGRRYVDDVIVLSCSFCGNCLQHMLACIYPAPLVVNVEGRSPRVEWLDLIVRVDRQGLGITQKPVCSQSATKHALPVFVNMDKGSLQRLWWWIASRTHRTAQIHYHDETTAYSAVIDSAKYAKSLGYSVKHIQRCYSRLKHLPGVNLALRARKLVWG